MTTGKALNGKPYAGNPHVRFDEGEVASAATPRRGSLLYNASKLIAVAAAVFCTTAPLRGEKVSGTPDKYIDYVASSSGQYIDTEIIGKSGTRMEVKFTGGTGNGWPAIIGCKNNGGTHMLVCNSGAIRTVSVGTQAATACSFGDTLYHDVYAEFALGGETYVTVDGNRVRHAALGADYDTGVSLWLLNGNGHNYPLTANLYGCKIWQTDANGAYQLVRDYRPCVKTVDGTARVGLYDTVSGYTYFSYSGTDFNAPPDTEPDYLQYVQSSGAQILDTEVISRSGTKWEMNFSAAANAWTTILGVFGGSSHTMVDIPQANRFRQFSYNSSAWLEVPLDIETQVDYTFGVNTSGGAYSTVNGRAWGTEAAPAFTPAQGAYSHEMTAYLFGARNIDALGTHYNRATMRIYSCKISQTSAYNSGSDYTPVRDFVPAKKYGLVGLLDNVSGVFFPGLGGLTAGPMKSIALVDSVKSDGALYVDTGITPKSGTSLVIDYADWTHTDDTWYRALAGAINGAHQMLVRCNDVVRVFGSGSSASGDVPLTFTGRHTLAADWTKGGTTYISADGGAIQTPLSDRGEYTVNDRTIWLFAANNGNAYRPSVATLYGARIWQDGVLVRDFRPCVTAAGKAALYDMVSASVYYAQGGDLELPVDTTERPATAVWKGGAVSSAADLANAANWTCTSLSGETIADAVPGGMTTINISSVSDPLLSIPSGVTVPAWAGVRISGNLALTADADWTKFGTVTLGTDTAINLAGHGLALSAFAVESGNASFNNSGDSTAVLTLTGAAGTSFNNFSIGDKVKVVKSGIGDAVRSTQFVLSGATGTELDIADGTFYESADLVAGWASTGTIKVSGGKVNTTGLTVAFTAGSTGVLEQSGGEIADTGDMTVGWYSGVGTVRQTGGKMTVGGTLRLSRANPGEHTTGTLTQSAGEIEVAGKVCIGMAYMGDVGVGGTMTVSGGVELGNNGGTGTLCVTNGGRLVTSGFVKGSGTANILFDGGTVQATAANANFFSIGAGPVTLGAGGLTLETAYDLGFNAMTITTSGGAIRKVGAGALDLSGLTVQVGAGAPRAFDFATAVAAEGETTAGVFTGLPTVTRPWRARLRDGGTRCKISKSGFVLIIK